MKLTGRTEIARANIEAAAERLTAAARDKVACAPVRTLFESADVDSAYAVQELNTERACAVGRRLVGRKIGLTSPAVQKQLGVDQPDFGMLFADMAMAENLPIPAGSVLQPKIEAEIALILQADLDQEQPTLADLVLSVAYVMPALEIVGSRIADWEIGIVDTIADNASSGLFVLGGPVRRLDGLDLSAVEMTLRRRDEVVSQGTGAACLGHPLNAVLWLAKEMVTRGRPLRRGDIVLSGALGPMVPVRPGDRFEATIEGLGKAVALFASE